MRYPSLNTITLASAAASAAALAGLSTAQELPSAIAGCGEVGCPNPDEDSIVNVCTLQNRTFSDVGTSDFGRGIADLTWVQGNNLNESSGGDGTTATVTSSFYLGTPFEYDPGSVRACAAFFHRTEAQFDGGNATSIDTSRGTCDQAGVSTDCITALVARARALEVEESDDACAMLQDDFRENLDRACVDVAGGDKWKDVTVRREYCSSSLNEAQEARWFCRKLDANDSFEQPSWGPEHLMRSSRATT